MCRGGSARASDVEKTEVYLSLGANLGDRHATMKRALEALQRDGVCLLGSSSVYETEPVDMEDQPWFLNLVIRAETLRSPQQLLGTCKAIESELGREDTVRFGPRKLDIDILLYGRQTIRRQELIVPHARMCERRFVLLPLVEIAPELTDPRDGRRFADVLDGLDEGKKVVRSASTGF